MQATSISLRRHAVATLIGLAAIFTLGGFSLHAVPISSVQDGDWFVAATWGGVLPGPGDEVTIDHNVGLGNSTPTLDSLTLNGGSLTTSGWNTAIQATTVTLNGGNLTHAVQSDIDGSNGWTPDARVWIQAVDVTVGVGAAINVLGKGYLGVPTDPGGWHKAGHGPGASRTGYAGAGHGGAGGGNESPGGVYGSLFEADQPGSGGGLTGGNAPSWAGGGAVLIEASGTVRVDGNILANAHNPFNQIQAPGSGGSVRIEAGVLEGSGTINANGGGRAGGVGASQAGGGRVLLATLDADGFVGSVTANAGPYSSSPGQAGTIYQVTGGPGLGAINSTLDGTPQLDTNLSVRQNDAGLQFLRQIDEWGTFSMIWTDDSLDMLGGDVVNEATYTLSGLAPNFGFYKVFVDGVDIYGGFVGSDAAGMLAPFSVTLGSPHTITVAIPEPASGLLLVLAGLFGLRRRNARSTVV